MIKGRHAVLAAWGLFWSVTPSSAALPQSVAEVSLDAFVTSRVRDASPVFLSDDSVSLLVRSGLSETSGSVVVVLRLADGTLQTAARASASGGANRLLAVSDQRILVWSRRSVKLLSPDLRAEWVVPMRKRLVLRSFPRSGIIGEWDDRWTVIRLTPEMRTIRNGSGELMSLSDDVIVVRSDNTLRVESFDDRVLGSIMVPKETSGAPIVEVAGPDRLFLNFDNIHRIVDFRGKQISSIPPPPGWGFDHGWSSDGRRVLFDHYTRKASFAERAIESLGSILVPAPEESNGETITVVDTKTGKVCFRLDGAPNFGSAGRMHADISPSGRLVGVATINTFSVYNLPETCTDH